jgi:hypothetical protein
MAILCSWPSFRSIRQANDPAIGSDSANAPTFRCYGLPRSLRGGAPVHLFTVGAICTDGPNQAGRRGLAPQGGVYAIRSLNQMAFIDLDQGWAQKWGCGGYPCLDLYQRQQNRGSTKVVANARDADGVVRLVPTSRAGPASSPCGCQELTISTDCALIRRSSWPAGGYPILAETCGSR